MRVSAAHQYSYLLSVPGDVAGHDYTIVDGSTNINMSLSLEGQNLTDTPLR